MQALASSERRLALLVMLLSFLMPGRAGAQERATPASGFTRVTPTEPPDSVLRAYFARLRFVTNPSGADERPLAIVRGDSVRLGPRASIQPEVGSHNVTAGQLRRGRVMARIVNRSAQPHARLGMEPNSITYFWVQSAAPAGYEGVMITTDAETGRVWGRAFLPLHFERHPGMARKQALMRWTFVAGKGDQCWMPDPRGGCSTCDTTMSRVLNDR